MAKVKYQIPVKNGEQVELIVETQGSSGDGICRHQGYTLFVPGGLPGDRVSTVVKKTTPRFGVVEIRQRLEASKDRIEAPCPVFPACGGCKFQDYQYQKQLDFKVQMVADSLQHIGKIDLPVEIQAMPAERIYNYRNKGSFAVQLSKPGTLNIGFYKQGTHDVVDSDTCGILHTPINAVKEWVRHLLVKHRVPIYNETRHKGFFRGLVVRHSESTGETLLGLISTKGSFPKPFLGELLDFETLSKFGIQGIVQNLNEDDTNIILGEKNRILWGENQMQDALGELRFRLSIGSFFQVHPQQAVQLNDLVKNWAQDAGGRVIDAYSGVGAIALWLAKAGQDVTGIEEYEPAFQDAKNNARLNGIENAKFLHGTVEQHLPELAKRGEVQTLIFDPPRKGCSEEVIKQALKMAPKQIIYVSCNPSTLARDIQRLFGYRIRDCRVIDMFPQTQHVETAVLLTPVE